MPANRQATTRRAYVTWSDRLRPWGLAAALALYVARVLLPSEAVAARGDGLPLAMGWCLLALAGTAVWLTCDTRTWRWTAADTWVLALFAWLGVAAAVAVVREAPRPAWNMLWEFAGLSLGYFLLRQWVRGDREARQVVAVMLALAVTVASYGLRQYFFDLPATRAAYDADPETALRDAGQYYPPGSPQRWLFEQRLASLEPLATFALSNSLAGFLTPWLVVWIAIGQAALSTPGAWKKLAWFVASAVLAACLLLTKSRSAYLAVGLGMLWVLVSQAKPMWSGAWSRLATWLAALLVAGGGLVGFGLFVGGLDWEVLSEAPKSLGYRWQYWQASLKLVADRPGLGCGPGNFGDHYTAKKLPTASEEIVDPHNLLLEVASTSGLPGLAALVGVLIVGLGPRRRTPFATHDSPVQRPCDTPSEFGRLAGAIAFAVGCGIAYLLASLCNMPYTPATLVLAWLVGGAVLWALDCWWVPQGRLPREVSAAAGWALVVNLLAAGGWSFPGVAGSFWLLLALSESQTERGVRALPGTRALAWGVAAVVACLTVGCFVTGYGPVLRAAGAMHSAELAADGKEAIASLREAAQADPWASEPWRGLAAALIVAWDRAPTEAAWTAVQQATDRAIALRPRSSSLWLEAGDYALVVHRRTHRPVDLARAVRCFERAVELYPNQPARVAKLALVYQLAGLPGEASTARAQALALDQLTPHSDQKLSAALRAELERIATD